MVDPKLRAYNAGLAVTHLVLGIGFSMYFAHINKKFAGQEVQGLELSLRTHSLTIAPDANNVVRGTWSSKLLDTLDLSLIQRLLVGFFFVTAAFHLYYAASFDGRYGEMIERGNNYVRWIEYSISSTMMLYVIALLSGVKDKHIYQTIFATNIAMIYTGQVVEDNIREGKSWVAPMAVGFMLLIAEFSIIIRDFNARLEEVDTFSRAYPERSNGRTIPSWLKYMVFVLFAFFSCFGFISLYGAYSGAPYENVEKLYLLFSLAAKATLGFFLAYGLGIRQERTQA
jgi:hypothetical protein